MYLEISDSKTGKTERLIKKAIEFSNQNDGSEIFHTSDVNIKRKDKSIIVVHQENNNIFKYCKLYPELTQNGIKNLTLNSLDNLQDIKNTYFFFDEFEQNEDNNKLLLELLARVDLAKCYFVTSPAAYLTLNDILRLKGFLSENSYEDEYDYSVERLIKEAIKNKVRPIVFLLYMNDFHYLSFDKQGFNPALKNILELPFKL